MSLLKLFYRYRVTLVVLLVPLCLMALPLTVRNQESLAAFLLIMMGIFWCTEIIPLPVTALFPVVFLPLFGILTTRDVCSIYMRDINMLLMGGVFIAIAVENVNLHRRIGIKALLLIGFKPRWLILGFMLPAWFLSMWISNTATTAMMMPIVDAVLEQLHKPSVEDEIKPEYTEETSVSISKSTAGLESNAQPVDVKPDHGGQNGLSVAVIGQDSMNNLDGTIKSSFDVEVPTEDVTKNSNTDEDAAVHSAAKGMVLCVAFAANVGGTGTLIGTAPNLIVQAEAEKIWRDNGMATDAPITFTTWMVFGMPMATLGLFIVWVWFNIYFIGIREFFGCKKGVVDDKKEVAIRKAIEKKYTELGPISGSEICVLLSFVFCVALWFFRKPLFMPGWADLFEDGYVTDAVPAIITVLLMFIIPQIPNKEQRNTWENPYEVRMLLDWYTVNRKMSWGLIFILGGGLALGEGVTASGLAVWIGEQLSVFEDLPGALIVTMICLFSSGVTQVMSNTATCTLFMPIVITMAVNMGYNPLYFMLPVGVSTSFALLLPVATAPNAIAYGTGKITVWDMVKAGIVPNLCLLPIVTLGIQTWGWAFFNLGEIPWDTNDSNTTTVTPLVI